MKGFTDHPFEFLGDTLGKHAPLREINILWWDGDKYATIEVNKEWITKIKVGYCYRDHTKMDNRINPFDLEIRKEY